MFDHQKRATRGAAAIETCCVLRIDFGNIPAVPVYLFTFHAYRSWMPDHRRGYTRRSEGYFPTDDKMAQKYRDRAKMNPTIFNERLQRILIQELIDACAKIDCRLHAAASDVTHIHALISWKIQRGWMSVRKSIKTSLSKRLKTISSEIALSRAASRKQVKDRKHFEYLVGAYLPKHSGLAWYDDNRGWTMQNKTRHHSL